MTKRALDLLSPLDLLIERADSYAHMSGQEMAEHRRMRGLHPETLMCGLPHAGGSVAISYETGLAHLRFSLSRSGNLSAEDVVAFRSALDEHVGRGGKVESKLAPRARVREGQFRNLASRLGCYAVRDDGAIAVVWRSGGACVLSVADLSVIYKEFRSFVTTGGGDVKQLSQNGSQTGRKR